MKRSDILLNLPSLSALRPDDTAVHDVRLQHVSPPRNYLFRTLNIARTAEAYLSLCIRDKAIGRKTWAMWGSIGVYVPMYLDVDGCLGIVNKIEGAEARELYRSWT